MYYFGPGRHPFLERVPRPLTPCAWCAEPFAETDCGVVLPCIPDGMLPYHDECLMRTIVGSVAHQLKVCPCFSGEAIEDAPGLSKREAAKAAVELWASIHKGERRSTEGKGE
jgi:hypothetical protein